MEVYLTIVLNLVPIVILIIPYFFIRKKFAGNLYLRIYAGILIFYIIYWVLPTIFQIGITPEELEDPTNTQSLGFLPAHFGSLICLQL